MSIYPKIRSTGQLDPNHAASGGLDANRRNRRRLLKFGAATAGALAFGRLIPPAAAAAAQLQYMCWEGYNDSRIVEPFARANDCDVAFDLIIDSPGGFAKLQAGASREIDIVSTDMPWVSRMGPAGLAMELDLGEFSDTVAEFYDQFKPPFAPLVHDGKTIGLPTRWGWCGPSVNTEISDPDEWRSYDPVFDPRNRNRIAVMDWGDWPILPMALYAGVNPYEELDNAALEEVRKVLRALFRNTRALVSDLTVAQKGLIDGSLLGFVGNGSYMTSAMRKAGYKNVISIVPEPRNGLKQGIIWVEGTAILKDTDQPGLAKKMLKHLVSKEVGRTLSLLDTTCNLVTNRAVEAMYTPEERSILQMDYMWTAWDNSEIHRIAPNIDEMLAIWQEEVVRAA
jgi:spermidine/putrescine transport system substrate-binding protein